MNVETLPNFGVGSILVKLRMVIRCWSDGGSGYARLDPRSHGDSTTEPPINILKNAIGVSYLWLKFRIWRRQRFKFVQLVDTG